MKQPKKIYLVTSEKARDTPDKIDLHLSKKRAQRAARNRNKLCLLGGNDDWRVVVYVPEQD